MAVGCRLSAIGWRLVAGISSGGFMRRLSRSVLFCPLHRGKSGAARIGGDERSEPIRRMVILPYDTESQSRNVLASPFRGRGPRSGEGVDGGKIVQNVFAVHRFAQGAADWRSGPRWSILSVLCPVHPFPLRGTSPQGETRDMREKTASHILQVPFRRFPPLVPYGTTFPPRSGGTMDV